MRQAIFPRLPSVCIILLTSVGLLSLTGCATGNADGSPKLVLPSKGWIRPNTSGKQTYDDRQLCAAESEKDPMLHKLRKESRKIPVGVRHTREEERIFTAGMNYQATIVGQCLINKGYKRGKLRPDQVYIPPLPPKWDWVKPGVDSNQSSHAVGQCFEADYRTEAITQCMKSKGFQWQIVDPHPSSPFD